MRQGNGWGHGWGNMWVHALGDGQLGPKWRHDCTYQWGERAGDEWVDHWQTLTATSTCCLTKHTVKALSAIQLFAKSQQIQPGVGHDIRDRPTSFAQALNVAEARVSAVYRCGAGGLQQHAPDDSVGQAQVPLPGRRDGAVIVVGHCEAVVIGVLSAGGVGQVGVLAGLGLVQASRFEQLSPDGQRDST